MVYRVPSHTQPGRTYLVDATANNGAMHCACPNFRAECQPNLDAGHSPFVRRGTTPHPTLCIHCVDLIFYFTRELFREMALSETQPAKTNEIPNR